MQVYLNGRYIPKEEAVVPVDDRAFVFGDGVYEVTRAIGGRLFGEEAHWLRLERGLRELEIDAGEWIDRARVREISERLLADNGLDQGEATVYLQISRGVAPRTHWFPPRGTPPTVYAIARPFEIPTTLREQGARAITLPDIRWSRCDLKTVNLLANVVAKQRAHEADAFDAVLIRDGAITEGASSNIFGVIDGEIRTYPKCNYILPGVTRDVVIALAQELGFRVSQTPIFASEIPRLEELFFTGTTTDVQAVATLDDRPVGEGRPGPVARALGEALVKRMQEETSAA